MLNRKKFLYLTIVLIFIFGQVSFSQTSQWKIRWAKNDEVDMLNYLVYKDVSPGAETEIAAVDHPNTVYVDTGIEKGVLYYYRLKAVDNSQNKSGFSVEVNAAIPKISFPDSLKNRLLVAGKSFDISLDNYVSDPDDQLSNLQWKISGGIQLNVQFDDISRIVSISAPSDWNTPEALQFTVTDPDTFYDVSTIRIFSDSTQIPTIPTEKIIAYPIPYEPAKHVISGGIVFKNLPENSKLIIYNFLGEPVFKKSGLFEKYIWNVTNNSGKEVSSGLFLYYVKAQGKTSSGKLVIVR